MLKALSRPNHSQVSCDMRFGWLLPVDRTKNSKCDQVYTFCVEGVPVLIGITLVLCVKANDQVAAGISTSCVDGIKFCIGQGHGAK